MINSDKNSCQPMIALVLLSMASIYSPPSVSFASDNGFDLSDTLIPRHEILHGGPPRDGIPAIDQPYFVNVKAAKFLKPEDRILGLVYAGVARAYPVKILNYHEIVNDIILQQAIVISYCPLCGSGVAFKPEFNNLDNTFGVSGLLYNSDMLLYDRHTESLWSQIMGTAISGRLKGKKMAMLALVNTSWASWSKQHPDTQVLSTRTGYAHDYDRHPYGDYDVNRALYFPVSHSRARYHPKERVIGLIIDNQAKAYAISELDKQRPKQGKLRFTDKIANMNLIIEYDASSQSAVIYDENEQLLPSISLFWFAWVAFHPQTEVYQSSSD